jgi:hypothetical protein
MNSLHQITRPGGHLATEAWYSCRDGWGVWYTCRIVGSNPALVTTGGYPWSILSASLVCRFQLSSSTSHPLPRVSPASLYYPITSKWQMCPSASIFKFHMQLCRIEFAPAHRRKQSHFEGYPPPQDRFLQFLCSISFGPCLQSTAFICDSA